MDAKTLAAAEKYQKMLQRQREYYYRNADKISNKLKEKYHQTHPDAIPRPNRRHWGMVAEGGMLPVGNI